MDVTLDGMVTFPMQLLLLVATSFVTVKKPETEQFTSVLPLACAELKIRPDIVRARVVMIVAKRRIEYQLSTS
jgi:hypothetical protein